VDYDAEPSGRRPATASGRYVARTQSPQQVAVPPPREPATTPETTPKPPPTPAPSKTEDKPGFDLTPVIMVLAALASAAVGYIVLTR
jgi:hypothetical protein